MNNSAPAARQAERFSSVANAVSVTFFRLGMALAQQVEKLDAVEQRHVHVHDREVHLLMVEQFQRGVGGGWHNKFPSARPPAG